MWCYVVSGPNHALKLLYLVRVLFLRNSNDILVLHQSKVIRIVLLLFFFFIDVVCVV